MEIIQFVGNRRRRGYNRLSPTSRRNLKIVRLKGPAKRSWRLRLAPKLRLASPVKLWYRFKNAYMRMMLKLADISGTDASSNEFGAGRIPKAREGRMADSRSDFENRLILEIYKSMSASLELGYTN